MWASVWPDARGRYTRKISTGLPASAGFSPEQFRFLQAMEQIQGKEVELVEIDGGVVDHKYVLQDTTFHGQPNESKVIAVPIDFFDQFLMRDSQLAPLSTDHQQFKMFAKKGLGTVRLLTSWVDGFCAFRKLTAEEKKEFA